MKPIDPNATYDKRGVAELLGVSAKTVERMSGISLAAVEEGRAGELPPPFYLGKRAYWRGDVLLAHLDRKQREAIRAVGA